MYSSFPGGPPGGAPQGSSQLPFGAIPPGTGTGVSPHINQGSFNYPSPQQQLQHTPTFPQQQFQQPQPFHQFQQPSSFSQPQQQHQQQYFHQGAPPPPPLPPTSPPVHQHQWGSPQLGGYNPAAPPRPGPQGNSGLGYNPNGQPLIHQQPQYVPPNLYGPHATGQPAPPPPQYHQQGQQHQNQAPPPPPPPLATTHQQQPFYQHHQQNQGTPQPPSHNQWDSNVEQQYQSHQPSQPSQQQHPRPHGDYYSQGPSSTGGENAYLSNTTSGVSSGDNAYDQKPNQFDHVQQPSHAATPPPPPPPLLQSQLTAISQPTPSSTFSVDGVYGRLNHSVSTPTPPPAPATTSGPAKDYPYNHSSASTSDYPCTQAAAAKWSQSEQSQPAAPTRHKYSQQIFTSSTSPPPPSPLKHVFTHQPESRPTPPLATRPTQPSDASASVSSYQYPPPDFLPQSDQHSRPTPPPLPQLQQQFSQQIHTASSATPPPPKPSFPTETHDRPTPPPLPQFQHRPSQSAYSETTIVLEPMAKPSFHSEQQIHPTPPSLPQFEHQPTQQIFTATTATPPAEHPPALTHIPTPSPKKPTPPIQPLKRLGTGLTSASVFSSGPLDSWEQFGYYQSEEQKSIKPDANSTNLRGAPAQQEQKQIDVNGAAVQENHVVSHQPETESYYQPPTLESVPATPSNVTSQHQMGLGYVTSVPPCTIQQGHPAPVPATIQHPVEHAVQTDAQSIAQETQAEAKPEQLSEEDATIERLQELDPFYQDSITRFIVMIESEAAATTDEEKLKVFKEFMEQEYFVRGQRYPLAIGDPPSRQGSLFGHTDQVLPKTQIDGAPDVSVPASQQPAQHEPVIYSESLAYSKPVQSAPVQSEPVLYHEPVQTEPVGSPKPVHAEPVIHYEPIVQPVQEPAPEPAQAEPVYDEPKPDEPNPDEPKWDGPTRESSPVSSVSTAPYKPFRPTTPNTSGGEKYVPFSPPQPLFHKPAPPQKSPSPQPQKPTYVPYKPPTFGSANPRRNSYTGYEKSPTAHSTTKMGEGYTPFRPGANLGPDRPLSTIQVRPLHAPELARPQSTIDDIGPPRRAETSIEAAGIHGVEPMSVSRKDETFLPVNDSAADNCFPSAESDGSDDEPEAQAPVAPLAPLASSRTMIAGLARLVPPQGAKREKSPIMEEMKTQLTEIGEDFSFIEAAVEAFEKSQAPKRKKVDEDRRVRQEEHQDYVDGLFADNRIGYGDIGDLDDEFAESEEKVKKKEETAEYDQYVKEVFEPVYNKLQEGIKDVMNLRFKAGGELPSVAVTGRDRWIANGRPELESVLQMLVRIDGIAERRHTKVHEAILARDRKFRRTVTEPLRTGNNIKKMKEMIAHFDKSEKKLTVDAAHQKLSRTKALIAMIERHVDAGLEHDLAYITAITAEINKILPQLPTPPSGYRGDQVLLRDELARAQATLKSCLQTAENLMKVHHVTLLVGNVARHEAAIAEKGEDAEGEDKARKADEAVDSELKERIDGLNNEYGIVVGNLEMVVHGLKDAKPLAGPSATDTGRRSRAGSSVGVRPLDVGRLSPRPHSRQGSYSSFVAPPGPARTGTAQGQMSALERAKLRNQGGSIVPYS